MKFITKKFSIAVFCLALTAGVFASTGNNSEAAFAKPTVVVIKADWCGACQRVDPIVKGLMKEYQGKFNFVVLDVTNEADVAKSMKKAKALGLAGFFNANKRKTSTVAVFNGSKKVFHTYKNYNRSAYKRGFEKALK